ncbi:hypothetical protein Tco_1303916 [Tanacetum coccineum]
MESGSLVGTYQVHRGEGSSGNGGISSSSYSYALILNDKISTPKVTIRSLHNNEVVQGTDLAIPLDSVNEISANMLYGYFIGKRLAFPIVERTLGLSTVLNGLCFITVFSSFNSRLGKAMRAAESTKAYDDGFVEVTRKKVDLLIGTNSFDALSKEDDVFESNNDKGTVTDELASSILDSNYEEVEEVFAEKDLSIEPMDGVFDDARKKVEAPPKKTLRKTGIWSGRKADSPKRNIAFSPETKVHYFDREDIEEVEHENCWANSSLSELPSRVQLGSTRKINHSVRRFSVNEVPEPKKKLMGSDFQENSNDETDERSSEEYLRDLELEFHERALLANSKCFMKRKKNYSQKANEDTELSKGFQPNFTTKLIQSSQHAQSSQSEPKFQKDYKAEYKKMKDKLALLEASPSTYQSPKPFQTKNKGLVAETFDWNKEEVSDDEEMTQGKVLMALADDELSMGKNHACNGKWIDITIKKVNILLFMDKDFDWQTYLKYINIDLKYVEEQRLNLLSKYNKIVFELNKCRDDLLALKQAKLEAVTFQIQNIELTKLNHAFQEQLKEERKVNEKWLNSSNKVSQCFSEQTPNQKKKILGGEQLTESSSKNDGKENPFIPASLDYDHEMVLKSKD